MNAHRRDLNQISDFENYLKKLGKKKYKICDLYFDIHRNLHFPIYQKYSHTKALKSILFNKKAHGVVLDLSVDQ